MKFGITALTLMSLMTHTAQGQITFFQDDASGFTAAIGSASQLGVLEDFENNTQANNSNETLANPLVGGVPNGSFTNGLRNENLSIFSIDNGKQFNDLALLTQGTLGVTSDVVTPLVLSAETAIVSSTPLRAISIDIIGPLGTASCTIDVYSTSGSLIDSASLAFSAGKIALGIVSASDDIAEVHLTGVGGLQAELIDNITMYVTGDECLADVNGDGSVTPADFTAWVAAFNSQAPQCDQNGDGSCTPADFTAWVANFNAGCN